MSGPAIRAVGLSKRFRIGRKLRYKSLRESIQNTVTAPFRRGGQTAETIWALRDVSFEVAPGEVIGVIGRNGAGKSTLLKVLARITEPTEGRVELRGRVGSLLEVGTGFHLELTGRENIFLAGAILGMKRVEIVQRFDEIVAFAEIDRFLDTPVKHYSTGMYLRLAFAVAAHLEPEILLVDEVLAVGDAAFQKKCLGKLSEVASCGRTVFLVSHNMLAILQFCRRVLLLDEGTLRHDGTSSEVVQAYLAQLPSSSDHFDPGRRRHSSPEGRITNAWIEQAGARSSSLLSNMPMRVPIEVELSAQVRLSPELVLRDGSAYPMVFMQAGLDSTQTVICGPGSICIVCDVPPLALAEGRYYLDLMLADPGIRYYEYLETALALDVQTFRVGSRRSPFHQARGLGVLLVPVGVRVERNDGPVSS